MAEYIEREARYIDINKVTIPKGFFEGLNVPKLLDWLNSQPTADVVEVVRCKNCKYKHITSDCRVMCKRYAKKSVANNAWLGLLATDDSHFCSCGERKED